MSFLSSLDFSTRRVLVTGGSKGIGLAIATKCVELNAKVFVIGRDEQALKELTTKFPSITALQVDLTDWEATRKAVESILPIHHLANNAGGGLPRTFLEIDLESINATFDVNFKAVVNVSQVVAKGMISHGIQNGTIVNISSVVVTNPNSYLPVYCASKEALSMLTKSMAVELAPHGIRVNSIRPALVNTSEVDRSDLLDPSIQEEWNGIFLKRMLSHKMIEPVEIANAFIFLSCKLSSAISGTDLTVDDGFTIL